MSFGLIKMDIPEVVLIEPETYSDERGVFTEKYKLSDFKQFGIDKQFVQFNHTRSKQNVLRGLHYQLNPMSQGKLLHTVVGEIFDVAIDIRKESPYYKKWVSAVLSSANKNMLFIPEGFAHGFCVLSDIAEVIYYCTKEYAPGFDRGIIWNDSTLNIDWPIKNPILSEKDSQLPSIEKIEKI